MRYPDEFAAALAVSGGWSAKDADRMPPVPLWIFHSVDDPQIPVRYARGMAEALEARRFPVKYTELSGVGHASWGPAFGNHQTWDWLFQQSR